MTKNSACCLLAVCSITHGAILPGWSALSSTRWLALRISTRWPTASEEATAATSAATAATRNNEQKIRRHGDGTDARCESESLIIGFAGYGCQAASLTRRAGCQPAPRESVPGSQPVGRISQAG